MATKKLSVEVDVDTAEAKKKLQEMEGSGGKSVAPKVENAADNAARVIDRLSASAQRCAEATDAETAKKKLEKIEDTGGNSAAPQVENSAERMARSMDKASAATQRHAEAAEHSSGNLKQAAKAFAGMGVALATKYAEGQMEQGSPEQKAVGYIGGAVSGALARIGGSFAGGESANTMRNLEQHSKDQLTVLREIRDKKTGGTF